MNKEVVEIFQFNSILKFCHTSKKQWQMINVAMKKSNIKPTIEIFNTHLIMLQIEGKIKEAENIIYQEMKNKWMIQPNAKTFRIMNQDNAIFQGGVDIMRQKHLTRLWLQGGNEATEAAWNLIHALDENKVANIYHYNLMLKFCHTSGDQWEKIIVGMMKKNNITPNHSTYSTYSNRLRVEGKETEADQVPRKMEQLFGTGKYFKRRERASRIWKHCS